MPACQSRQDATGIKLKKKVTFGSTTTTTEYMDTSALLSTSGFQYKNTALDFFPTAEGYVKVLAFGGGTSYNYVFNYTDHLGNIRAKYTQDPNDGMVTLIEENQYYPSCLRRGRPDREEGIKHLSYNPDHSVFEVGVGGNVIITPVTPLLGDSYTYKFGGKEQQTEFDINTYDFGARNYDPALGRWMNFDPLAEYMWSKSPYSFAFNNPIYYVDPNGMMPIPLGGSDLGLGDMSIDMELESDFTSGGCPDGDCNDDIYLGELDEVVVVAKKKEEGKITTDGVRVFSELGGKSDTEASSGIVTGTDRGSGSINVGNADINPLNAMLWKILSQFFPENRKKLKPNESTMETNNEEPVDPPEETKTVELEKVTPHFKRWNYETIDLVTTTSYDTVVKKTVSTDSLIRSKDSINKSKIDKARKKFNGRYKN